MTTPIVLRLEEETLEQLDCARQIKQCTRTKLLRNAVNNYLRYFKDCEENKLVQMEDNTQDYYEKMFMGEF